MIVLIIGRPGEGKTLTTVKYIVDRNRYAYTNIKLKNYKKYHKLKWEDIITSQEHKLPSGKKVMKKDVNWNYWEKVRKENKDFSIVIDELHNIGDSRSSMSTNNKLLTRWLAQVRKVLNDSLHNDLVLVTQSISQVDVRFRLLAHSILTCKKVTKGKNSYVIITEYDSLESYETGQRKMRVVFHGNRYFKFYDYLSLNTFSSSEDDYL